MVQNVDVRASAARAGREYPPLGRRSSAAAADETVEHARRAEAGCGRDLLDRQVSAGRQQSRGNLELTVCAPGRISETCPAPHDESDGVGMNAQLAGDLPQRRAGRLAEGHADTKEQAGV